MLQALTAAIVAILLAVGVYWSSFVRNPKKSLQNSPSTPKKTEEERIPELSRTASALVNFDYKTVKPIPYRPFLSGHHYSVGISKITKEDWIQIDQHYLTRITERKHTLKTHPETCHAINNASGANAIKELFENLIPHLPARFPTIFALDAGNNIFQNHVTGMKYNLEDYREPHQMVKLMAENVEEDFYLMCPDEEGVFRQQALLSCFPNSFYPPSKLGLAMADIHAPVPELEEKIGKAVKRSMMSIRGGSMVVRFGWSLQFNGPTLFLPGGGNNFHPDPDTDVSKLSEPQDLENCFFRVERQCLLEEIRKEGNGAALRGELESMPEKLGWYKRRPFWMRDVEEFLRG
ncbi:MAG: hypothetical protein Q9221_004926 [Calogaya cf. arnoldii]